LAAHSSTNSVALSRKSILLLFIVLTGIFLEEKVSGQNIVVSSYFNANDPRDEWSELLVTGDNFGINGGSIRDNNQYQAGWQVGANFNNATFWTNLRQGTIIIVWHRSVNSSGVSNPQDVNKNDGYIEVWANDLAYFINGVFGSPPLYNGSSLNVAGGGDIIELRNSSGVHIHGLGHRLRDSSNWISMSYPKLNLSRNINSSEAVSVCPGSNLNEYGAASIVQNDDTIYANNSSVYTTKGLPNKRNTNLTANSLFWRSLRQPTWNTPTMTATFAAPSTINLGWNTATDPVPADGTQGYIILRNTSNTFTAPSDGHTYTNGDMIGTATVVTHIASSQTITYSDTYTLNCGDTVYYRIYAYRFTTDNSGVNDLDPARGRAYNETSFGSSSTGIPDSPVVVSVSKTDSYCGADNGSITITATAVTGVTIEYSIDGTNWQASNVFNNLPPGDYYVYVRNAATTTCQTAWTSNPVHIEDFASPTFTLVEHTDATCGNDNGTITITSAGGTAPIQYSIDNGNTWQTSNFFNLLPAGSYDVVIKDANDCQTVYTPNPVLIDMIPAPVAPTSAAVDRNNLCSDDAGDIVLTAVDGSGETLEWFTGSCGGTLIGTGTPLTIPSPAVTTTYYCWWTSTICGNTTCVSITVNVTDPPTVSAAGSDQTLCGALSTQLEGNQPVTGTGLWTQVNGPGSTAFTDPTLYNTQATATVYGTYTYRWTISNGPDCPVSTDDVIVSYGTAVTVLAGNNSPICEGTTILLTSSIDNAIYSWTGPNGFTSTLQNPSIPGATMADAGTYTVNVSNIPGGCPATSDDTQVTMLAEPVAPTSATVDPDTVCANGGDFITLTAIGGSGSELDWFEEACGGTVIGTGNNLMISAPTVTTTYYVFYTSDQCGNSSCASIVVHVIDPPTTSNAGTDQSLCGVLSTVLTGNNPTNGTGLWTTISGPGSVTFADPAAYNTQVTVTAQGIYVFRWTISSSPLCTPTFDEVSVNFGDAIQVVAASNTPVCTGFDINLTSSIAGATYSWTGPDGFTSNQQNPVISAATMAAAGTYTVLVTGIPGGCPDTQNSTDVVTNLSAFDPTSVTASETLICSIYTGNITLTANGGSGVELEWYTGNCGGTLIGSGSVLTIPPPSVTTTYNARWTSTDCGNSACKDVTITVEIPATPAFAGGDQAVCNLLSTMLQANTPVIGSGHWTTISGPGTASFSDASLPNSFVSVSTMGVYVLRWTISSGTICPSTFDDVSVEFSDQVTVAASSNSPVCEGDSIVLFSSISGATYSWSGPGGFISSLQNPVIYNVTSANSGDYSVTVTNIPGGCPTSSASTSVTVSPIPSAPAVSSQNITGSQQDVCVNSTINYSIVSPVAGSTYTWDVSGGGLIQPTGSSDVINIDWFAPSGSFDLTVAETNSSGCEGSQYLLTVNMLPVSTPSISIVADNNPACWGSAVQFTASAASAGTTPVYRWQRNGADVGSNDSVYVLDLPVNNDVVTCDITSSDACASPATITSNTIPVTVLAALNISCAAEDTLCAGTPTVLTPGSTYSAYLWSDGSTGNSLTVDEEGIYWVMVTDASGCTGSDTVLLQPCEVIMPVFAPNAFSPNGDGRNDKFAVVCGSPDFISDFEMLIYNRWGQMIFRSKDIGEGWDGTVDGNPCVADVYTYFVSYTVGTTPPGQKRVSGSVMLIR
jgi:gliding motility-associated-like protein